MRLGNFVEISVDVTDLGQSLPFYERLGFEKLDQSWEPWPWAVLTDGIITFNLSQYSGPASPVLNYFAADMDQRIEALGRRGVPVVPVHGREIPEVLGGLESPGGIGVSLVQYAARRIPKTKGVSCVKCGTFAELAVPVPEFSSSFKFWTDLGFERVKGSKLPFPWAVVSDGLMTLGLYQTGDLKRPALVYRSDAVGDRIELLREEGFEFEHEMPSPDVGIGRYAIQPPEQQLLILLE